MENDVTMENKKKKQIIQSFYRYLSKENKVTILKKYLYHFPKRVIDNTQDKIN